MHMPYSSTPDLPGPSTVCSRSSCDDPAVVVLARSDTPAEVLTARLCATHARDAVDELLRRIAFAQAAPALAIAPIDRIPAATAPHNGSHATADAR